MTAPIRVVGAGVSNALYGARRALVSDYIRENFSDLRTVSATDDVWQELLRIARIPEANRERIMQEVQALSASGDWVERATVIVMVYS